MSANQQPIRVGIIGTGIFAYRHLRAYNAVGKDKFQVVACANRSRDKAVKFAEEVLLIHISHDNAFIVHLALNNLNTPIIFIGRYS